MSEPGAVEVFIQKLPGSEDLPLPAYATQDASGVDLHAAVAGAVTVQAGERCIVPTGIIIALPKGYEAQVRPRSGLALKHGVTLLNTPGTIDADYRGEIKVILINLGKEPFTVKRGDRIAQLVIQRTLRINWSQTNVLDATPRGEGGFGHTG
ncbi:MAG: dUTP diphosphatase [Bacillota bacterium]